MGFDPYLHWLGVREEQRPLNYYYLLGTTLFEADPQVIAAAAERQIHQVRAHQSGEHAELAQRLVDELTAARRILLAPEKRAKYDTRLRAALDKLAGSRQGGSGVMQTRTAQGSASPASPPSAVNPSKKKLPVAEPMATGTSSPKTPRVPAATSLPGTKPVAAAAAPQHLSAPGEPAMATPPNTPIGGATAKAADAAGSPSDAQRFQLPPILQIAVVAAALMLLTASVVVFTIINGAPQAAQDDVHTASVDGKSPWAPPPPVSTSPDATPTVADRHADEPTDEEVPASARGTDRTDTESGTQEEAAADTATRGPTKSSTPPAPPAPWDMPRATPGKLERSTFSFTLSQELHAQLIAVREAMKDRDLPEAMRLLGQAKRIVRNAGESQEVLRLSRCLKDLQAFWTGVEYGLAKAKAGGRLMYRGLPVTVVSCGAKVIGIRDSRDRMKYFPTEIDQIDRDVAVAIVGISGYGSSRRPLGVAAFDAFDRAGIVEFVPKSCAEAGRHALNADYLMAEALYDFSRTKVDDPRSLADLVDSSDTPRVAGGTGNQGPVKRAAPDESAREKAEQEIANRFRDGYRSRDADKQIALAKQLFRQVPGTEEDAPRYVLLEQAAKIAGKHGDEKTAMRATKQLVDEFDVKSVETVTEIVDYLSRRRHEPDVAKDVLKFSFQMIQLAVSNDDFRNSAKLLVYAQKVSPATRSPDLQRLVRTAREEAEYMEQQFRRVESARKILANNPDDEKANAMVARYLSLAKGEYAEALKYFEKGEICDLADLVRLEVEAPTDKEKRQALAEGWWDIAQEEKNPVSRRALLRSGTWYGQLVPSLIGRQRSEAEKRFRLAQTAAHAAGIMQMDESMEGIILGYWRIHWTTRTSSGAPSTFAEFVAFDANSNYGEWDDDDAEFQVRGNWTVEDSVIAGRWQTYTDHFKIIDPNRLTAVRFKSGQPWRQGVGERYFPPTRNQ